LIDISVEKQGRLSVRRKQVILAECMVKSDEISQIHRGYYLAGISKEEELLIS